MIEFLKRLRTFWFPNKAAFWWLLMCFPGLLLFQTVIHEGTHDVVARIHDDSPKLAPFPHRSDKGRFQVGVTIAGKPISPNERKTCDPADAPTTTPSRLVGWIGWPQIVAVLIVVALGLVFLLVEITNPYLAFLLRSWLFAAAVDFTFNSAKNLFGVCDAGQDWSRVMIRGNIGGGWFWLVTLLLWVVVFVGLGLPGGPKHDPPDELDFWDYRWIAVLMFGLSLIAVLFSVIVSDQKIDKLTLAFWFFFMGQIGSLVGHALYFVQSFRRNTG